MLHVLSFLVDGDSCDVRDLGQELRQVVERAADVGELKLVRGPTILAGDAVDAAAEGE